MNQQFERTCRLLGEEAMERLQGARVAVFGIGGVGGYTVEALARSGIGSLDLIDSDTVALSNLNRQIIADYSQLGRLKVDVAEERIKKINPDAVVRKYPVFYTPETAADFPFSEYDYIADAIDSVSGKISLAVEAQRHGVPIISCMGAGNKLDPTRFEVEDLSRTSVCPLARVMRTELRKRGILHMKVVYSKEEPICPFPSQQEEDGKKRSPGSIAFVPSVAGLILAGEIIKDLAKTVKTSES